VTGESFHSTLWYGAIILGWLAIPLLGGVFYARRRFRALLKAPLTDEVELLTHLWERRISYWTALGLLMSGLSIICLVGWFIVRALPR